MDVKTKKVLEIIQKYAPKLAPHGVKLSAEDAEKKELEAMALMSEAMLDNGTKIYTPASNFEEGAEVFTIDDNGVSQPLADGEYIVADGTVITVVEGKISSMVMPEQPETETEVEVETEQAVEQASEVLTKSDVEALVSGMLAKFNDDNAAKENTIAQLTKELNDLKVKYNVLSKQAATVSVKQSRNAEPIKAISSYATAQERVNAILAQHR